MAALQVSASSFAKAATLSLIAVLTVAFDAPNQAAAVTDYGPPPVFTSSDRSVAFQQDAAHTGQGSALSSLAPPLQEKWRIDMPEPCTNPTLTVPIVVDGRIFVTSQIFDSGCPGTALVYAIDLRSGTILWGPKEIGGRGLIAGLAYENGRLFAVNSDYHVFAFDPATGQELWRNFLAPAGTETMRGTPVAADGILYVPNLWALDQRDGHVLWQQIEAGGDSSPAAGPNGIFVSQTSLRVYSVSRSGTILWRYENGFGGGGTTPALYEGRLYARDWNYNKPSPIFDANTGARVGEFASVRPPAFGNGVGYFMSGAIGCLPAAGPCTLRAVDLSTGKVLWSFDGDGQLSIAPIVVGNTVYIGSWPGNLYALDAFTGSVQWSTDVDANIGGPKEVVGLGSGDGYLVVPAHGRLFAFGPAAAAPTLSADKGMFAPVPVGYEGRKEA